MNSEYDALPDKNKQICASFGYGFELYAAQVECREPEIPKPQMESWPPLLVRLHKEFSNEGFEWAARKGYAECQRLKGAQ